jgi:hypothetical protein
VWKGYPTLQIENILHKDIILKCHITLLEIWYSCKGVSNGIFFQPFLKKCFQIMCISRKGQMTLSLTHNYCAGGEYRRSG